MRFLLLDKRARPLIALVLFFMIHLVALFTIGLSIPAGLFLAGVSFLGMVFEVITFIDQFHKHS